MENRKKIGTVIGVILFIITILSITYATYNWRSEETPVTLILTINTFFVKQILIHLLVP